MHYLEGSLSCLQLKCQKRHSDMQGRVFWITKKQHLAFGTSPPKLHFWQAFSMNFKHFA